MVIDLIIIPMKSKQYLEHIDIGFISVSLLEDCVKKSSFIYLGLQKNCVKYIINEPDIHGLEVIS